MEQNTTINPIKVTCVEGEFSGGYDVIDNHDKLNQYISWLKLNNWEELVNLAKNEGRIDNYQFSFIYFPPEPEIIEENIKKINYKDELTQIIDFHGDEIITIKDEKKNIIYVPLRQMCTNLGLDINTQLAKVKADPQKWGYRTCDIPKYGIYHETICIPIEKLELWILSINSNKVSPKIKEKIDVYQDQITSLIFKINNKKSEEKYQVSVVHFYNDEIISIKDEQTNIIYIPLRQLCKNIGINSPSQLKRVKHNQERWGIKHINIDYGVNKGGFQTTLCLPLDKLESWLLSININCVTNSEIKEKITLYQTECDHVLHEYWSGSGVVVNERKTTIPNEKIDVRKLEPIDPKNMKSVQTYVNTLTSHVTELTSHITYLSEQFNYAVETILDQEKMINYLAPKAEYYDTFMDKGNNLTIHEFSKSIPLVVTYSSGRIDSNIGKIKMFELLRQMGFLMNLPGGSMHNLPYARYMDLKIFTTRVITTKHGSFTQTLITPKGVTYLVRKFRERGWLPKTYFYNHQQITYNN
jgi:phage antirepressor YoqD-like protein